MNQKNIYRLTFNKKGGKNIANRIIYWHNDEFSKKKKEVFKLVRLY